MSSTSKKRGKTSWKRDENNEIIQISNVRCSWADEVEKADEYYDPKQLVLPSAPRASCMVPIDDSKVPHSPPFQAHVSNLPYELTEEELKDLFSELNVKEVKIPKEDRGSRARGYGYVIFEDRASLVSALNMPELSTKGRSVRIELSTSDSGRGGGRSRGNQRSDSGSMNSSSVDRTAGNWRSGPREPAEDRDRGYDKAGPRREYNQGGGGSGGGGGFPRRENDSFSDRRDREDRFPRERERTYDRPRYDDRPREREDWSSRDTNRGYARREDRPREDPPLRSEPTEPKNRRKLNLAPRSRHLPPPAATTEPTASNSIFGAAKPVDTSAKLREIEERLIKSEITSEKTRSTGSSSTGSSSGAPRSVSDKDRKLELAQPPKENVWGRPRPAQQAPRASRPEEQKDI